MKQPKINFYLPKAVTDDEIKLITDYCDIHDKSAWTKSDAKQYHLNHNVGNLQIVTIRRNHPAR